LGGFVVIVLIIVLVYRRRSQSMTKSLTPKLPAHPLNSGSVDYFFPNFNGATPIYHKSASSSAYDDIYEPVESFEAQLFEYKAARAQGSNPDYKLAAAGGNYSMAAGRASETSYALAQNNQGSYSLAATLDANYAVAGKERSSSAHEELYADSMTYGNLEDGGKMKASRSSFTFLDPTYQKAVNGISPSRKTSSGVTGAASHYAQAGCYDAGYLDSAELESTYAVRGAAVAARPSQQSARKDGGYLDSAELDSMPTRGSAASYQATQKVQPPRRSNDGYIDSSELESVAGQQVMAAIRQSQRRQQQQQQQQQQQPRRSDAGYLDSAELDVVAKPLAARKVSVGLAEPRRTSTGAPAPRDTGYLDPRQMRFPAGRTNSGYLSMGAASVQGDSSFGFTDGAFSESSSSDDE
jgi:hypothetical protein